MIFNLKQYLFSETGYKIYPNARDFTDGAKNVPKAYIQLIEEGGASTAWFKFHNYTVQVITKDIDAPKARVRAYIIYHLLDNKFGLILPEVVVDGITYSAIQIAQISANTEPGFLGYDNNGRAEFSNNYRILI